MDNRLPIKTPDPCSSAARPEASLLPANAKAATTATRSGEIDRVRWPVALAGGLAGCVGSAGTPPVVGSPHKSLSPAPRLCPPAWIESTLPAFQIGRAHV